MRPLFGAEVYFSRVSPWLLPQACTDSKKDGHREPMGALCGVAVLRPFAIMYNALGDANGAIYYNIYGIKKIGYF